VDLRRVSASDWAAGFCGAALVGLLWAPWFRAAAELAHFNRSVNAPATATVISWTDLNAWQAMAVNDVIFLIAGLLGIWIVVATATQSTAAVPIAADVFAAIIGLVASVLALIRLIWPPDLGPGPTDRAIGVWLGTAAVIAMTVAALLSMRGERRGEGIDVNVRHVPATQL
jgi:hypothetical protein